MLPNVRFPACFGMLFLECVVLPARQSCSPGAADFLFEDFFGGPSKLFSLFFLSPGGAQSHLKAPQGLPKAVPMQPHVLPGARFLGFGEPLFSNNNMVV